uniref:Uncharacterized protein n=4 Tax=Avena sativa TaxID=4498 RepID=A0ACD5TLW8_AVESA
MLVLIWYCIIFRYQSLTGQESKRTIHQAGILYLILSKICIQKEDMHSKGTPVYPKGSPKFNLMQANHKKSMKKVSPNYGKKSSPIGEKSRVTWNCALEKSLAEILHEHHTTYHRSQNGWNSETWNLMVSIFQQRNPYVNVIKSQIQDKEKDLKRDYRALREARKQSGVGWNEAKSMLQAEPHLWVNLIASLGDRLKKFKRKAFPLYDTLGELYDGQLAEGKLCFTSTAGPSMEYDDLQIIDEHQKEMEEEVVGDKGYDDDSHIMDEHRNEMEGEIVRDKGYDAAERSRSQVDQGQEGAAKKNRSQVEQRQVGAAERNRSQVGASRKNPKNSPKKKSTDGIVGVMERLVQIKEKEAPKEVAQDFTITRCMEALKSLEGVTPEEKITASEVFNSAHNREFFVNLVNDKDGTAIIWLRRQLARLN